MLVSQWRLVKKYASEDRSMGFSAADVASRAELPLRPDDVQ